MIRKLARRLCPEHTDRLAHMTMKDAAELLSKEELTVAETERLARLSALVTEIEGRLR